MQLDPSVLRHLLAQSGRVLAFHGMTHREVIGLAEISAEPAVTIVAERDRAEVYGTWIELRDMFLGLVGALVIVVAAVAFQMGRSIVVTVATAYSCS